jgi:flagellar biosynthesis GTPase FlhF
MSAVTDNEPRTYRGTDLDELLPKIREELGPDAIVLRQRDGLDGGIGGFFQKRCVEVVARRAAPRVNRYDEGDPAEPEPPSPAIQEIMRVASPFVEQLQAAQAHVQVPVEPDPYEPPPYEPGPVPPAEEPAPFPWAEEPLDEPVPHAPPRAVAPAEVREPVRHAPPRAVVPAEVREPVRHAPPRAVAPAEVREPDEPAAPRSKDVALQLARAPEPAPRGGAAAAHEQALVAAGIAPALAAEILAATISHAVPFAPKRALKHLVRDALAARIPVLEPAAPGGRTIAFVGAGGAGKTRCAIRVAAAYGAGSDLRVKLLDLAVERAPEPAAGALTVVDTPAVSPAAAADTRALARQLRRLGRCEVHIAVPATLSATAVRRLLDGFAPLKPAAIALTHLDEVDHAGPVIDEAIARGIALSYCSDADAVLPADPAALAARVLA